MRAGMAFADAFSTTKVSQNKPSNNHLVKEQRRRRTVNGAVSIKVNSQARIAALFNWLLQNTITSFMDIPFVRQAIGNLAALALAKERARVESAWLQWSRSEPFVCLCHAVTDVKANKESFVLT